jgi:hypothetical protein
MPVQPSTPLSPLSTPRRLLGLDATDRADATVRTPITHGPHHGVNLVAESSQSRAVLKSRAANLLEVALATTTAAARRLIVREPQARRAGRRFQPGPESRLEPEARSAIKKLPGADRGIVAVRELPGPFGVPDFVALVGGQRRLELRAELNVPAVLNEVDARLVAAAPSRGSVAIGELEMAARLPTALARRRVGRLTRTGALSLTSTGRLRRPSALRALGSIYAVEMKVANVRSAIMQCRRYHVWADAYVLVMGVLSDGQLDRAVQMVKADGGGLVVGGRMICRPRPRRGEASWQRLLASEHFFAATDYGAQPSVRP